MPDLTDAAGNQGPPARRLTRHGPVEGRYGSPNQRGRVHAHQGARRRHRRPPASLSAPSRTSERQRGVSAALIERIRDSVIGDDAVLDGPFGPRRLVYADYTASGRALSFVEDYIRDRVLPLYANTHTEASATGLHTTALREDARGIIHGAVNGGEDDVVVFCGAGDDGRDRQARPRPRPASARSSSSARTSTTPTSCRGASRARVVTIREDAGGRVDLEHREYELARHAAPRAEDRQPSRPRPT